MTELSKYLKLIETAIRSLKNGWQDQQYLRLYVNNRAHLSLDTIEDEIRKVSTKYVQSFFGGEPVDINRATSVPDLDVFISAVDCQEHGLDIWTWAICTFKGCFDYAELRQAVKAGNLVAFLEKQIDFEKVHQTYVELNWIWTGATSKPGNVPSKMDLLAWTVNYCRNLVKEDSAIGYFSSGGITVCRVEDKAYVYGSIWEETFTQEGLLY